MNGGLSGLSGTFIGLNYETNNFLGLGETLSLQANIGDLSRNLSFGFTEPYLRNKPISLGFQLFTSKYDFNPAKSYGATGNISQNLSAAQQSQFTNYNQATTGLTVSVSEPLRKFFRNKGVARVGASFSLSRSSVTTFNDNTRNVFQSLAFRSGVEGQNQLNGIITSVITPTFTLSSLDRAVGPHNGKDLQRADPDRRRGRQRQVLLARHRLSPVLAHEGAARQPRRPQRPRLPYAVRPRRRLRR